MKLIEAELLEHFVYRSLILGPNHQMYRLLQRGSSISIPMRLAPRVFHLDGYAFEHYALEQALAPEVFHLNFHAH